MGSRWYPSINKATIFGGALVLTSINRQVRLGDFLFTGE